MPYRAYEAEDPKALAQAIEDIGKLEKHPIYTTYMEPRREYAGWLYLLAAACAAALLLARQAERLQWARPERAAPTGLADRRRIPSARRACRAGAVPVVGDRALE